MKYFVVAYIDTNNVLVQTMVSANDWREALAIAHPGQMSNGNKEAFASMTQAAAQEEAFNQDWNFSVLELELTLSSVVLD